jgi:uncharacterized protein (DUF1501 family)
MMNRRAFIGRSVLASAAVMLPDFLRGVYAAGLSPEEGGKVLVVVQLSGGNDGLNTIIPFRNDDYYSLRPGLALKKDEYFIFNDEIAFNNGLSGLRNLFDNGEMKMLNSVGYPNPDRSHFRAMDIWHTASDSNEFRSVGWLGKYLDHSCNGCALPHSVIELDDALSLALKGDSVNGLAVSNPDRMRKAMSGPLMDALVSSPVKGDDELSFIYKTLTEADKSVDYLYEQSKKYKVKKSFPNTAFARDLRLIAELISAGSSTRVYYVSLSGFDTHNNQKNRQLQLFKEYGDAMEAFRDELKLTGRWKDTLVLTFSEFGRRVEQNASNGTDHGKANSLWMAGGSIQKPGAFNQLPDLKKLDEGDLPFEVDFREVYASVLDNWLSTDADVILGRKFKRITI